MYFKSLIDKDCSIADVLFNLGVTYQNLNKNQMALEYHSRSLKIRSNIYENIDNIDMAHSLNSIGTIYANLNEHEKSLDYKLRSYEMKIRSYKKESDCKTSSFQEDMANHLNS